MTEEESKVPIISIYITIAVIEFLRLIYRIKLYIIKHLNLLEERRGVYND